VAKKIEGQQMATLGDNIIHNIQKISSHSEAETKPQLDTAIGEILFGIVQMCNSCHLDAEDVLRKKTMQVIAKIDAE
jgi:hypothetical protein